MINSRDVKDLHPVVGAMCTAFLSACKVQGIDVIVTSTYRDFESQNALYAQGRTEPGPVVTEAKGGQSFHNYRVAFDFVPIVNGKCQWDDGATWLKCGVIGEKLGLAWAGRWTGALREQAHMQFTNGLQLADFQAGRNIPAPPPPVVTRKVV